MIFFTHPFCNSLSNILCPSRSLPLTHAHISFIPSTGNQFNNRVIQSFIFCHNLIKNPNTHSLTGKNTNRCALYMCYMIMDCSLHWFLVINQCTFFRFLLSIQLHFMRYLLLYCMDYIKVEQKTANPTNFSRRFLL